MHSNLKLCDLQISLSKVITDSRGVTDETLSDTLKLAINEDVITVGERLSIYAEGYFFRILQCLEKDFVRTHKILGEELFSSMVAAFLKKFPSKYFSIDEVGRNFAPFLTEMEETASLAPWVKEIAEYEWLRKESLYSGEIVSDPRWQEKISTSELSDMRFRLEPSLRFQTAHWNLFDFFTSIEAQEAQPRSNNLEDFHSDVGVFIIHYRTDRGMVSSDEVSFYEYELLRLLSAGFTLEAALNDVQDLRPETLTSLFTQWSECGFIQGFY